METFHFHLFSVPVCLLIVGQPQVKQCWEDHAEGVYTVRLLFNRDLLVELRNTDLSKVLASETIAVIKEGKAGKVILEIGS